MIKPTLKTKITLILPLATCMVMAMLLYAALRYAEITVYAPIVHLQIVFAAISIPTLLLLFFALRRLFGKITEPLLDFTRHVELLPTKTGTDRLYPQQTAGEIATLSNAFNNLISDLDRQRKEMAQREEYLRALHETTIGLIGRLDLHSLLSAIITRA